MHKRPEPLRVRVDDELAPVTTKAPAPERDPRFTWGRSDRFALGVVLAAALFSTCAASLHRWVP